ncbi:circadian clock protein KaiC [Natrinema saccharevitans]|uniref:Circadian clock protein KaiC n=1 Tax=Natrinema saccharevitans TaxID=301967 RepID=A0A1S8AZ84_9EURY|nr:KaiC domain-containing protein [Natrinema saccharevitans]OLZ42090.1 circadian clock protein KaiC [Natrinema saccharevitans]
MVPVSDDADDADDDWFDRALDDEADAEDDPSEAIDEPDSSGDGPTPTAADDVTDGERDDSLFEEDFGSALHDTDAPAIDADVGPGTDGPEGFDDLDFVLGGDEPDFDEAVDSDLPRLELGIEGLDRMIQGGIPKRSLIVAMGSAGTGKTTFGLQFLTHGLEQGERAVFITLEESRDHVITSATEKGYGFDEYVADGQLAVVDVDPIEMANSLASIRNELPALVEEFGASRLVLDSVSLLEMMYEDRAKRRNEIYDFARSLKEAGVTALLTSEASPETAYSSRYGIVEYLTDAVFVLQYVRPDDFRETRLAVEIQKIRDANHSREKKPYEITGEGISVYQQANLF